LNPTPSNHVLFCEPLEKHLQQDNSSFLHSFIKPPFPVIIIPGHALIPSFLLIDFGAMPDVDDEFSPAERTRCFDFGE
jgi:hypothetical protein